MYSQRNASGEQLDVHFCTCRARCRTSKLPAAQTTGCLECVKGKPAVDDKLGNEVMNLLMSLRAPRQALGGVAGVWGVPPTSSSNPPHHHTASQSPTPRPPSWTKSPKWRPSLLHGSCLGRRKQRKEKNWGVDHLIESWSWKSSNKMQSELAEWDILCWNTFDTFLVSLNSLFLNPSHPCTIGTTTLDPKFISGRPTSACRRSLGGRL